MNSKKITIFFLKRGYNTAMSVEHVEQIASKILVSDYCMYFSETFCIWMWLLSCL